MFPSLFKHIQVYPLGFVRLSLSHFSLFLCFRTCPSISVGLCPSLFFSVRLSCFVRLSLPHFSFSLFQNASEYLRWAFDVRVGRIDCADIRGKELKVLVVCLVLYGVRSHAMFHVRCHVMYDVMCHVMYDVVLCVISFMLYDVMYAVTFDGISGCVSEVLSRQTLHDRFMISFCLFSGEGVRPGGERHGEILSRRKPDDRPRNRHAFRRRLHSCQRPHGRRKD